MYSFYMLYGGAGRIRTGDFLRPRQASYQARPQAPDKEISGRQSPSRGFTSTQLMGQLIRL